MSNYATKAEVQGIVNKAVDDLTGVMTSSMQQVDTRFNKIESEKDEFKQSMNRLTNTIDAFLKRLDDKEANNKGRDYQFEKLLSWTRKVSKKTGIPLVDL